MRDGVYDEAALRCLQGKEGRQTRAEEGRNRSGQRFRQGRSEGFQTAESICTIEAWCDRRFEGVVNNARYRGRVQVDAGARGML